MQRILPTLALLATLAASPHVQARQDEPYVRNVALGQLLTGVALNAAEASRTITLAVGYYKAAGVVCVVDYTYSAATDVQVAFTGQLAGALEAYGSRQSKAISSGTGTLSDYTEVKAVSADAVFILEYGVRAYRNVKLVFSGTSAGAGDTVDVACTLVAGGG